MSLSGCAAVMRVSNQSEPKLREQSSPRPMKPRQSGRTISIRNAKQYKSFHMPTQINLNHEAGCCCDDANAKHTTDQPGQCQVNHHELMQTHRSHIDVSALESTNAWS